MKVEVKSTAFVTKKYCYSNIPKFIHYFISILETTTAVDTTTLGMATRFHILTDFFSFINFGKKEIIDLESACASSYLFFIN